MVLANIFSVGCRKPPKGSLAGCWAWLFPGTYLVHIGEEFAAEEGFPAWLSMVAGVTFTPEQFLILNTVFWLLMVGIVGLALVLPRYAYMLIALASIVLTNTLLHIGGTIASGSFSPGLVSAVLLWLPLGLFTFVRGWNCLSKGAFTKGVVIGLAGHLLVSLLALNMGWWASP